MKITFVFIGLSFGLYTHILFRHSYDEGHVLSMFGTNEYDDKYNVNQDLKKFDKAGIVIEPSKSKTDSNQ